MIANDLLLTAALLVARGAEPEKPSSADTVVRDKDKESVERVLALAKKYEFFGDARQKTRFVLRAKPVLTYANPIRGEVYGNVFVWTYDGRPEVIGAIFDFRNEDKFDSELHTLARDAVSGWREGRQFWSPERAGARFATLPDGPEPAISAAARLRQMRDLAKQFIVERDHPEQGKGEMRLLTQPLYRYESPQAKVLDGALFVFAEGTDPEAFLLLEAAADRSVWQFAFVRMNIVEFRGKYGGKEVWRVEPVSWDTVFDKQEPYAIVREKPSRGLVRSK
jgi:hypothetical protein